MDVTKVEAKKVEQAHDDALEVQMQELSDLQLSFVGGGIGEVIVG